MLSILQSCNRCSRIPTPWKWLSPRWDRSRLPHVNGTGINCMQQSAQLDPTSELVSTRSRQGITHSCWSNVHSRLTNPPISRLHRECDGGLAGPSHHVLGHVGRLSEFLAQTNHQSSIILPQLFTGCGMSYAHYSLHNCSKSSCDFGWVSAP